MIDPLVEAFEEAVDRVGSGRRYSDLRAVDGWRIRLSAVIAAAREVVARYQAIEGLFGAIPADVERERLERELVGAETNLVAALAAADGGPMTDRAKEEWAIAPRPGDPETVESLRAKLEEVVAVLRASATMPGRWERLRGYVLEGRWP